MNKDSRLFALCLSMIEDKLGWGESSHWTTSDFEMLSELILKQTSTRLSPSTLKRLFGRVTYESSPQSSTLNALAKFLGYGNFRDFQKAHTVATTNGSNEVIKTDLPKNNARSWIISGSGLWTIGLVMGFVLSILLAFSLSTRSPVEEVDSEMYSFSSKPVSQGIPNSVIFTFDVSHAKTDCLKIQQSWDKRLQFDIKKDQQVATSIYYYPGFFRAKLLVDDLVVKEHGLLVPTNGWLPLVAQQPVPVYFNLEECIENGNLQLTTDQLTSQNIPLQPEAPMVSFYNIREIGNLEGNHFTLETSLKNNFGLGSGACQMTFVVVICKNSLISIPLSIPGCTSDLNAFIAGNLLNGKETDLSSMGVDFSDWVNLRLAVAHKNAEVFIDESLVLQSTLSEDPGEIVGIAYHFQGTGAIDYVRLTGPGAEIVYHEDFEKVLK